MEEERNIYGKIKELYTFVKGVVTRVNKINKMKLRHVNAVRC